MEKRQSIQNEKPWNFFWVAVHAAAMFFLVRRSFYGFSNESVLLTDPCRHCETTSFYLARLAAIVELWPRIIVDMCFIRQLSPVPIYQAHGQESRTMSLPSLSEPKLRFPPHAHNFPRFEYVPLEIQLERPCARWRNCASTLGQTWAFVTFGVLQVPSFFGRNALMYSAAKGHLQLLHHEHGFTERYFELDVLRFELRSASRQLQGGLICKLSTFAGLVFKPVAFSKSVMKKNTDKMRRKHVFMRVLSLDSIQGLCCCILKVRGVVLRSWLSLLLSPLLGKLRSTYQKGLLPFLWYVLQTVTESCDTYKPQPTSKKPLEPQSKSSTCRCLPTLFS